MLSFVTGFLKFTDCKEKGGMGEREREKTTLICFSTYLCIHWLLLVCALSKGLNPHLGISGQYSNQLSYPALAVPGFFSLSIILYKGSSLL